MSENAGVISTTASIAMAGLSAVTHALRTLRATGDKVVIGGFPFVMSKSASSPSAFMAAAGVLYFAFRAFRSSLMLSESYVAEERIPLGMSREEWRLQRAHEANRRYLE